MAVDIRFLGHVVLRAQGAAARRCSIDPFLTGNPKAAATADELEPDVILLTHGHADHLGDTVDIAKRTGATVVAIVELANEIGEDGVEDVRRPEPRRHRQVRLGLGQARARLAHRGHAERHAAHARPGLLIHIGDTLVYHLGDTCLFSDLQLIARRGDHVDVALVPIGGHYTMDRLDAVDRGRVRQPGRR